MKRVLFVFLSTALFLSVCGCAPDSDARRAESRSERAERKAGAAAYELAQESKAAAKKACRQIHEAGKQLKAGWNDAKQQAKSKDDRQP